MTLIEIKELIASAEYEAGELMRQAHAIIAESKSGARDVVTEYDRRVQQLLEQRFRAALPKARFFCEEMDEQDDLYAQQLFIIDPIDGTMNFVHGLNHSCVSVAYAESGTILVAAVYNPYVDELFTAIKGQGAFLNGKPIHVCEAPLRECMACFGTAPYYPEFTERSFRMTRALYEHSLDIRRQGAAELDLCSVAAGRAGLYVEMRIALWDHAAGALIVEEAGGVCLTEDGRPLPYAPEKTSVLAGGPQAVKDYFELVRPE